MSWTKRQFVEQAFEEIGRAGYVFDLQPEQLQLALRRLDAMMATWNGQGIRLAYPLPSSPEDSSLDAETNVPDSANEAIYTNLAKRIAPTIGKVISPDTKTIADKTYRVLLARSAQPGEMQLPGTLPSGAGNKPWRYRQRRFINQPQEQLQAGPDNTLEFE